MKKVVYLLLFVVLSLVLVACPRPNNSNGGGAFSRSRSTANITLTGTNVSQDRTPSGNFTGVWASNGVVVSLRQADTTRLTMTTDEGYVTLVQVHINNQGVLELGKDLKASTTVADVSFELATDLTKLASLQSSFSSQLTAPDMEVDALSLKSGGTSRLELGNITATSLIIDTGGESTTRLVDVASQTLSVDTGGESNLVMTSLHADTATIDGGGDSKLEIKGTCSIENLTYDQGGDSQFVRTGC